MPKKKPVRRRNNVTARSVGLSATETADVNDAAARALALQVVEDGGAALALEAMRKLGARSIVALVGCDRRTSCAPAAGYVWRNLPLDVGHVLAYFVAHEGHHRGQLVMAARQLGQRLPPAVTNGLWQWSRRGPGRGAKPAPRPGASG